MELFSNAPAGARQAINGRPGRRTGRADRDRGLRLLSDPAFDVPGLIARRGRYPAKTGGPAAAAGKLGAIHAVLLSCDEHAGNACLIFLHA